MAKVADKRTIMINKGKLRLLNGNLFLVFHQKPVNRIIMKIGYEIPINSS